MLRFVFSLDKRKSEAMSENNQWGEKGTLKNWCIARKEMRLNNKHNGSMGIRKQKG